MMNGIIMKTIVGMPMIVPWVMKLDISFSRFKDKIILKSPLLSFDN